MSRLEGQVARAAGAPGHSKPFVVPSYQNSTLVRRPSTNSFCTIRLARIASGLAMPPPGLNTYCRSGCTCHHGMDLVLVGEPRHRFPLPRIPVNSRWDRRRALPAPTHVAVVGHGRTAADMRVSHAQRQRVVRPVGQRLVIGPRLPFRLAKSARLRSAWGVPIARAEHADRAVRDRWRCRARPSGRPPRRSRQSPRCCAYGMPPC